MRKYTGKYEDQDLPHSFVCQSSNHSSHRFKLYYLVPFWALYPQKY